jgi:hypothetical protein
MKLLIDYDGLAGNAASAMRQATQLFERAGLHVIDVSSGGRTMRLAGMAYREATLVFADSQRVTLRIKSTGDVYEARINGKVVPIKDQDDPAKAVAELVALLDAGRTKFQRRIAALRMQPPAGIKTAAPRVLEAVKAQLEQVETEITAATEELASLQAA